MAGTPKTGTKRSSVDGLTKDAAPKAAKENEDQTATEAANDAVKVDFKETDKSAVVAEPPKAADAATKEVTEQEPTKVTGGDPLGDAAANGGEKKAEEPKTSTAAGDVEATKATEKTEKPEAEEGGKKVAHEGIAEGKSTKDVE